MLYFNCFHYFYYIYTKIIKIFYYNKNKNKILKIKKIKLPHYTISIEKVDDFNFSIDNGPIYI